MEIKFGLISCDSHAQLDRDAFTSRMSRGRWGERIPQVVELELKGKLMHRWVVDGNPWLREIVNCPAAMPGKENRYPDRWEDVPPKVYDPVERAKALDEDGVDAEVLFPNVPFGNAAFSRTDPEFELACTQAYNDALGAWTDVSDRFIPLALVPSLSSVEDAERVVRRAIEHGHRGITLQGSGQRLADSAWSPLWEFCQEAEIPVNFHAGIGVGGGGGGGRPADWAGYTMAQRHTASTGRIPCGASQGVAYLFFSGILDRYPRLKIVTAETATGWMAFVIEACDYEWERRHLWTEGIATRPSEAFRRQVTTSFWFEQSGIQLRDFIGVDNIVWESDFPHITSTYPHSWQYVERTVAGVPEDERRKLLYENALRLYRLT